MLGVSSSTARTAKLQAVSGTLADSVQFTPYIRIDSTGAISRFTHLAINPNVSKGGAVVWLQPVTDEEYHSYQP